MAAAKIAASTGVSSARYGRSAGFGNVCPIANRLSCHLAPCGGGRTRSVRERGKPRTPNSGPPLSPTLPRKGGGSESAEGLLLSTPRYTQTASPAPPSLHLPLALALPLALLAP